MAVSIVHAAARTAGRRGRGVRSEGSLSFRIAPARTRAPVITPGWQLEQKKRGEGSPCGIHLLRIRFETSSSTYCLGFSGVGIATMSITWITPFLHLMSVVVIFAPLNITSLSLVVMTASPFIVLIVLAFDTS